MKPSLRLMGPIESDDGRRLKRRTLDSLPHVPRVLLIEGPAGVGKIGLAREYAAKLLGEPEKALGRIEAGTQLDYLEPETVTKVDEIRNALDFGVKAPVKCLARVVVLRDVEGLTVQGADALLKTLEEPPPYLHFILTLNDDQLDGLIPTVRSRCVQVYAGRLSPDEMREVVPQVIEKVFSKKPTPEQVEDLMGFCRGVPGRVEFYVRKGAEMRRDLSELLVKLPRVSDWQLMALVKMHLEKDGVEPADWIRVIEDLTYELVCAQSGVNEVFPGMIELADRLGLRVFDIASKSRVLSRRAHLPLKQEHHVLSCLLQIKEAAQ